MKGKYHNVMEDLVEQKYDQIKDGLDCCTCERCKQDILAQALNKLPCKYVVTEKGEVYSKAYALRIQHDTDIITALTAAANQVRQRPRH